MKIQYMLYQAAFIFNLNGFSDETRLNNPDCLIHTVTICDFSLQK